MSAVPSEQTTSNVAEFFSPGPGERLRAARLSMGYDIGKIASELHLTVPVVQSLEADDYEVVDSRVFVRGYLRNYARIVGVPVDSILRQFDEKWPDDGGHRAVVKPSPRLPADGGPARGLLSIITWLIIVGLLVLFLMWWRGHLGGKDDAVAPSPAGEPADEVAVETLPDDGSLSLPGLTAGPGELRIPSPSDAPALTLAADTAVPAGLSLPGSEATDVPLSGLETASPAPVGRLPALPVDGVAEPLVTAGVGAAPPAPETTGQVVMTFTGPCWVDVRDSERKFKLFGEMPKGTQKILGGTPPYKMVLGNANAVTITIDGVPYDLRPHAKGNVARFTLDP